MTTSSPTHLLVITSSPHTRQGRQAFDTALQLLTDGKKVQVFFYADGAYTANRLAWQSSDVPNLTAKWSELASQYDLALPVCVSTALARGITDKDNAKRHSLDGDNLHPAFSLVGLSELALMMAVDETVVLTF